MSSRVVWAPGDLALNKTPAYQAAVLLLQIAIIKSVKIEPVFDALLLLAQVSD